MDALVLVGAAEAECLQLLAGWYFKGKGSSVVCLSREHKLHNTIYPAQPHTRRYAKAGLFQFLKELRVVSHFVIQMKRDQRNQAPNSTLSVLHCCPLKGHWQLVKILPENEESGSSMGYHLNSGTL